MLFESIMGFITNPGKMLIVTSALILAIGSLVAWKRYHHSALLYAHLFFVLSPVFYFSLSMNCSMGFVQGLLAWCTVLFAKFVLYLLPPIMALSFITGYIFIPKLYSRRAKPFFSRLFKQACKKAGIAAGLFLLDSAKPVAFASGRKVFVSVGMFDILSKRELEAVFLHELYHVKSRSSWGKFSAYFVHTFSPIAWFSTSTDEEERLADTFAAKMQKTRKHLASAKRKVR